MGVVSGLRAGGDRGKERKVFGRRRKERGAGVRSFTTIEIERLGRVGYFRLPGQKKCVGRINSRKKWLHKWTKHGGS